MPQYPEQAGPPASPQSNPHYGTRALPSPYNPHPPYAQQSSQYPATPVRILPKTGNIEPCEGARILAWVGSETILACDVMPLVNQILEQNKDRIPPEALEAQREILLRRRLESVIENKLIYSDAKRAIPEDAFPNIEQQLTEQFEKVELKEMMKRAKVDTLAELREKLGRLGTSLERAKRSYMERTLAQQWVRQQIKYNEDVTHQQMLDYYQEHLAEFEHPAKARWEQLTVSVSEYRSKEDARAALAHWGNQVIDGAPFAGVAKSHSDGSTASEGGIRDWTTKGSLVSDALDQAIFTLPPGRLSPIIEDKQRLHIIRVIERKDAGRTPFVAAQVDIKQKIRKQRLHEQQQEYLARLKKQIPVRTVFDDQPLSDRSSRSRR